MKNILNFQNNSQVLNDLIVESQIGEGCGGNNKAINKMSVNTVQREISIKN
jgi:hypothetical protein